MRFLSFLGGGCYDCLTKVVIGQNGWDDNGISQPTVRKCHSFHMVYHRYFIWFINMEFTHITG